jgi:hypothetical protein
MRHVVKVLTLLLLPAIASAQDAPPTAWGRAGESNGALDGSRAPWLDAWSPLRPITDIARGAMRAPLAAGLLVAPNPIVGAFTVSGTPAALARDVRDHGAAPKFYEIIARSARESGTYRRPLDVADAAVAQVIGQGWATVGTRGVAIGRFVIDRESIDQSSFTARINPYSASPFVMTDSVQPPMLRTRARLEGALSLTMGAYAGGISAAVESREHNSIDFPLRRSGRMAVPAVTLGVERTLPWLAGRVGAYTRWQEPNESNILSARPLATEVYAVQAYDEPFGLPQTPLSPSLFARNDRRATAQGLTLDAAFAGVRVVLVHERGRRAEDQTLAPFAATRAIDRWRAEGAETRFTVSRSLGSATQLLIIGSQETLDGSAVRADLTGTAITGSDTRHALEADVRWTLSRWSAAARGGVVLTDHARRDFVAEVATSIQRTTPFVSAEVARQVRGVSILLGGSATNTGAKAGIPTDVAARGPEYRRLIAGDLAYEVADGIATAAWVGTRIPVGKVSLHASVRVEQSSARTEALERLQPTGERRVVSVVFGVQ